MTPIAGHRVLCHKHRRMTTALQSCCTD